MYPQHIQEAAAAIGRTLTESATPLYGSGLRLPDRRAVIELVKEVRRLLFPAYFGDPALMSLAPENYAALLLERICEKLTEQLKLALPEDQVGRAEEIAREFARRLPQVQKLLLEDLDATFESDPAAASREAEPDTDSPIILKSARRSRQSMSTASATVSVARASR